MITAFYNGIVHTADDALPEAQGFIVKDGRFAFVGTDEEVIAYANRAGIAERVNLQGRCVIPGLTDSHCHFLSGLQSAAMNMIFLEETTKPEELGAVLAGKVVPDDDGLVAAMGIDITNGTFSARDLDGQFPNRPVMVFSFDGHALLLNSKAMEQLGVNRETEDPDENSYFARNPEGNPTGLVIEIPAMMRCRVLLDEGDAADYGETLEEMGFTLADFSVYPDTDVIPNKYTFLIEPMNEITEFDMDALQASVFKHLCEANPVYFDCYDDYWLGMPEVHFLQPETSLLYRDMMVYRGASLNQLKPVRVIMNERQRKFFFALIQKVNGEE